MPTTPHFQAREPTFQQRLAKRDFVTRGRTSSAPPNCYRQRYRRNAVIRKAQQRFGIYAGNPASLIRTRISDEDAAMQSVLNLDLIASHFLPILPRLLADLQQGTISLDGFRERVTFLEASPTVQIGGVIAPNSRIGIKRVTGYTRGELPVSDAKQLATLNKYFASCSLDQIPSPGRPTFSLRSISPHLRSCRFAGGEIRTFAGRSMPPSRSRKLESDRKLNEPNRRAQQSTRGPIGRVNPMGVDRF